jgi:hypothetical protein
MDTLVYDLIAPVIDEYIGDELTLEDLRTGYSAFLEDEQSESHELAVVESR